MVFGGLHIISIVLGMFFGISLMAGGLTGFSMGYAVYAIVNLVGLVLWILLMIKAYQGERFRVPVAATVVPCIPAEYPDQPESVVLRALAEQTGQPTTAWELKFLGRQQG